MRILTPSRIHITLIDLNGELGRVDGGVGLALESPNVEVEAKKSDKIVVTGGLNRERFERAARIMAERFDGGIEIKVLSDFRSHVGLGSGTQISLAVGKIYSELYSLDLSVREVAEIMGRGGTSGIGVAAFEYGGFIVDGGHRFSEKGNFLPSSASKAKPAPMIARLEFPDWKVIVAVPELTGFHGKGEVNLFQKYCPIPLGEVRELCHLILMKLLPGVAEADLDDVGFALRRIQQIGFKKVEVDQYGDLIRGCFNVAECIGMSSTGPTVYAFADTNAKDVMRSLKSYFEERDIGCKVFITKARNRGAEIV